MRVTKLLVIFSCIALFQCYNEDTTYNSDKDGTCGNGGGPPCPQFQTPKTKKFKLVELNNVKQTRYPGGDTVAIKFWCEHADESTAVSEDGIRMAARDTKTTGFTKELDCPLDAQGFAQGVNVRIVLTSDNG